MTRKMIFPLALGLIGAAILAGLGFWQLERLAWKQAVLADIDARMTADAVAIPPSPKYEVDNYRRVMVAGKLIGPELHVLVSRKPEGPSFRVIQALRTASHGDILIDLGTVPESEKQTQRPGGDVRIDGNLIWPDETDGFTPDPDQERNMWFARDVARMSGALGTRPVMVVATASTPEMPPRPWPVGVNVPNDHLQYAITWFLLMVIWLGMTGYMLLRIKRNDLN